jgi:hypothetical protein
MRAINPFQPPLPTGPGPALLIDRGRGGQAFSKGGKFPSFPSGSETTLGRRLKGDEGGSPKAGQIDENLHQPDKGK